MEWDRAVGDFQIMSLAASDGSCMLCAYLKEIYASINAVKIQL